MVSNMGVTPKSIIGLIQKAGISVDLNDIDNSIRLRDQGLDSLDMMSLFLLIEESFNIIIADEEYKILETVDEIVVFLKQKLNA